MSDRPAAKPLIDLATRAEGLGYGSLWVGDSLVARPRHEPLSLLAAIAARTTTALVGTAVLLPVLRHPVLMAHQVATVDQIAEGRLVLGVGIAADAPPIRAEFATASVPFEHRVGRMNEHLELCRRLWSGQPVTHHGRFYSVDEATIGPTPHRPGGPPIWVAGSSAAGQRRAGRRYDGWFPIGPAEQVAAGWSAVQAAATEAGRDQGAVTTAVYLTVSLDDDPAAADQALDRFLAGYYPMPPATTRSFQATFAGRPDELAPWAARFVEAGASHLVLRFPGDHERHLELCASLAQQLS